MNVYRRQTVIAEGLVARAVLVDMEPKVISAVISQADASSTWSYDKVLLSIRGCQCSTA